MVTPLFRGLEPPETDWGALRLKLGQMKGRSSSSFSCVTVHHRSVPPLRPAPFTPSAMLPRALHSSFWKAAPGLEPFLGSVKFRGSSVFTRKIFKEQSTCIYSST